MLLLDLDLDFFLNKNAYRSESTSGRQGGDYKPWSISRVASFLEGRCRLSLDNPVPGRTLETHDRIIDFWRMLIQSGELKAPFDVIHIDAHPDLSVRGGLYIASGMLRLEPECELEILEKQVHCGNYLTLAVAFGWLASLTWIPLILNMKDVPKDCTGRAKAHFKDKKASISELSGVEVHPGVPYKVLPWRRFRTDAVFDFVALSKSPSFTPPESDDLVPMIERYMKPK
jgi:hypothetical protein